METSPREAILFVDNEIDSPPLKPLLDTLGKKYRILPSRTLEDAELRFKYDTESIDMVILDIHFGTDPLGGLKLLKKIRKTDPYLPVGMITQYDGTLQAFESGQKLATFYLPKPNRGIDDSFIGKLSLAIEDSLREVRYLYDRKLMKICNSIYAERYDAEEYAKPGTVAFCHWEDTQVLITLDEAIRRKQGSKIRILDVGCGTGRFEVLLKTYLKPSSIGYDIIAMDFSGKMLLKAKEKIENNLDEGDIPPEPADSSDIPKIRLQRGFAERLPFQNKCFDLVIAGFGIPSYTQFNFTIPEIYRVLDDEGLTLLTAYNRDALFHKISDHFFPDKRDECPMASRVIVKWFNERRDQGTYFLAPQGDEKNAFPIQTFNATELSDILNRFNFEVENISTFPVLNSIYPISHMAKLVNTDVGEDPFPMTYKSEGLFFSRELYELDKNYATKIGGGGYYITAIARRR
jgi:ubiquinone/menaquinone biosynthesis C-methylase UbiE/CheY-like chemotaxis protein